MGKFYKLRRAKMLPKIMGVVILGLCSNTAFSYWGDPVKLPDKINKVGRSVYYARISPDGQKLFFTAGAGTWDQIFVAHWNGTDWGSVKKLGPNINGPRRTLSPSVTADGKKLYFVCYGRPGGYGSYDVWYSEWQDTCWGPAKNCGPNVNTAGMEFTAFISPDGRKLYFSRYGARGLDILCSEWDSINNEWGPAQNLGSPVNTSINEVACWVSADGKTLYFSRWSWTGDCGDIYISHWDSNGWTRPGKLRPPINTKECDLHPSLSPDGTKLYFASDRGDPVGYAKLWVSEWIPIEVLPWSQDSSGFVGDTIWYSVRVRNDGEEDASFNLKVVGNKWNATIWDSTGTKQISSTGIVPPDKEAKLIVKVVIPERLSHSAVDSMRIYATLVKGEPSIITDYAKIKTIGKLVYSVPFLESFENKDRACDHWVLHFAWIENWRRVYGVYGTYDGDYVLALNATNYHVTNCPNSDYSDRPWYPIAMCCIDRGTNPAILSFYWRVACASNPTRKAWLDIYDGNWHTRVDSLKSEYTGWQRVLVDLSSYANSRITLRIRSSILDGYVYLDQMQVYETGIEEHFVQPSRNGLCLEVRPNLTFGNTKIYYVLPRDGEVKLSIYNLTGEIVRLLIRERQRVGDKKVLWDGKDAYGSIVPAGIYFCILEFEGRKAMQKLIKLR